MRAQSRVASVTGTAPLAALRMRTAKAAGNLDASLARQECRQAAGSEG
jgi:hypothetical protein